MDDHQTSNHQHRHRHRHRHRQFIPLTYPKQSANYKYKNLELRYLPSSPYLVEIDSFSPCPLNRRQSFLRRRFHSLCLLLIVIMSEYENVVGGKLKLKGKALDVKAGGVKKKKKNTKSRDLSDQIIQTISAEISEGGSIVAVTDPDEEDAIDANKSTRESNHASYVDNLTPAERRYMEQRQKIDMQKMAKTSNKSHRDRIEDFNQYLANMSEHYDIPKVGPG